MPDFELDNLTGGLNYRDTFVTSGKSQRVYWVESKNVKPFKDLGIQRCRGNTLITNHETKIISAGNYPLGNDEYIMFVDSDGSLFEYNTDEASESDALVTGLDGEARGAWAVFGQGIIYSNGVDEPFIYFHSRSTEVTGNVNVTSGSKVVTQATGESCVFESELQAGDSITINSETHIIDTVDSDTQLTVRTNFANTASDKAVTRNKITWLIAVGRDGSTLRSTAIAVYKGRVYIGYNGGLYWTAAGTYTDWLTDEDAGYNKNFFNQSSHIQALSEYGNFLAIHRKEQIILMEDAGDAPEYFIFEIKANRGSLSQFGTVTVQNDHLFYDAGIFPLGETGILDQIILKSELSAIINSDATGFLKGIMDASRVDEITLLHNRGQKEIWCYFPITNLTYFQYVYVYDYQQGMWYRRISPQETTCAIEHKDGIYSFDSDGKIYREDFGSTWNEENLDFYIQTAYLNFGEGHRQKDIDEVKILVDTEVTNSFNYKWLFDYDSYNSSATQSMTVEGDDNALVWADDQGSNTDTVWANDEGTTGNDWASIVVGSGYLDNYNGIKGISLYCDGTDAANDLGIVGIHFKGVTINSQ